MYIEKDNIKKFLRVKKQRKYKKLIIMLSVLGGSIAALVAVLVLMYFSSMPKVDYTLKNRFSHFYK